MRTQREYMLRPGPPEMSMSATCIKEASGIKNVRADACP